MKIPRPEYPRPQMVRDEWMNLNGVWQFEVDNSRSGKERKLYLADKLSEKINVPFCPESKLSGLSHLDFMECVWYMRSVSISPDWVKKGRRTILNIGACDFDTEVYVNGESVGRHIGGYVAFSFDITEKIKAGDNKIVICAVDLLRTATQPGGKQSIKYYSYSCSYTRTTGIWQTVWLENVADAYIKETKYHTSVADSSITVEALLENARGKVFSAVAKYEGKVVGEAAVKVESKTAMLKIDLSELHLWNVGDAKLYDLELKLGDDLVKSYFGMRTIEWKNNRTYINGKVVFQRLILDQGFYPDGIFTAPTEDELVADIQRSLDMGFNGARLHQKVFEPLFLYHCDKMGYIVWGEDGNWGLDIARPEAWRGLIPEWMEVLRRDYNHPAIIGWCPLNETQTNQNRDFVKAVADLTRAFDPDRLYIDSSGWTHQDDLTDIMDYHDYEQDPAVFKANYDKLMKGGTVKMRRWHDDKPTFVSEYGGIWWSPDGPQNGWGYGGNNSRPRSKAAFIARYKGLTQALLMNSKIGALCYTQLTDVEQEVNGLYTYDRKPKFDPKVIKKINTIPAAIELEETKKTKTATKKAPAKKSTKKSK